jgi:hypothetical protein
MTGHLKLIDADIVERKTPLIFWGELAIEKGRRAAPLKVSY